MTCPEEEMWSEWSDVPMKLTWYCPECNLEWVITNAHALDEGGICPECEQWILTPPTRSAVLSVVPS